ncbi:aflatoxin efflux pump AFLT [Kwoniella heveanensis CBS 569]|nr:aflatoxin efflux pump AFLT [Kwoniella heveanensis CBS 569]
MASPTSTIHSDEDDHSLKSKSQSHHNPSQTPAAITSTVPNGSTAEPLANGTVDSPSPSPSGTATPTTKEKKVRAPPAGHAAVHAPIEVPRWRFWAIFLSLMISIFLFALDQLIVATAIPKITSEFNSLTKLSWLASGFFLTLLGFNLLYAQWMNIFPSKHVMLFAVVVFEIGSLVCGVAPSMDVLILGRAIAGLGASGIFSGGMVIIAELTPLHSRAQYFALFGVCFAVASVIGPLVGGAFSDHVSWRWCFYINLPIGGVAVICLLIFQPSRPPLGRDKTYKGYSMEMVKQVIKCDWVAVALATGWGCSFILFTQWGGVTKKWSDGSVIACIVLSAILPIIFCVYEWWMKDMAYFRIRLLKRRNIIGASIVSFMVFGVFMILVYYLSLTYQAVYHTSATGAGVKLLPLILIQVFFLILSSRIIPKIGRFKPVIVCGPILLAIASGLFYTIRHNQTESHLYGFQVILGAGIGMCLQNVMISVQHELKNEPWLISLGTGLAIFIGFAGRIVALSLSGSVFENMIQRNLREGVPGISEELVAAVVHSASAVWESVPEELQAPVLKAYTKTLSEVFIIALPMSILALIGALIMKNDKMLTKEEEEANVKNAKEKAAADALREEENAVATAGSGDAQGAIDANVPQAQSVVEKEREVDGAAALAEKEGKSAV